MTPFSARHRGMALIAVLWLVASMSLIIAGVVKSVRSEARSAGMQRQFTLASAKADAAMLLALQRLQGDTKGLAPNQQYLSVNFDGMAYDVRVTPLNGLLDINSAPPGLLTDFFQYAAGASPDAARNLAQATLDTRRIKNAKGIEQGFDAVPDLLNVPGLSYELYAKVSHLVTADIKSGGGRINPLAAPLELLVVLASGNTARAVQFAEQRNTNPKIADTTFFKSEFIEMAASNSLSLQVKIELPDGVVVLRDWHVYWGADERSGLPWRVLDVRPVRPASLQFVGN